MASGLLYCVVLLAPSSASTYWISGWWFVVLRRTAGPLIRKYLLDNGHRVTVELRPDATLGEKIDAKESERLQVSHRPPATWQGLHG